MPKRPPYHQFMPQPGSLADLVLAFLRANPDEELSSPDVAQKFDAVADGVRNRLSHAVKAQALVYRRNSAGQLVYRLPSSSEQTTINLPAVP